MPSKMSEFGTTTSAQCQDRCSNLSPCYTSFFFMCDPDDPDPKPDPKGGGGGKLSGGAIAGIVVGVVLAVVVALVAAWLMRRR